MTTDLHAAVFAVLDGGTRIRVSPWLDWPTAIERWTLADDLRRDLAGGGTAVVTNVAYFAVRHQGDPAWSRLDVHPEWLCATEGIGNRDDRAVLRRLGAERGLEGREGGWIYSTSTGEAITQGWRSYARPWRDLGFIVERRVPTGQTYERQGRTIESTETRYHLNAYRHVITVLRQPRKIMAVA